MKIWQRSFAALLFLPGIARAATTYTLEDCFQAALKRSETLASQGEVVFQAEERYHQAIGSVLPNFNASYQGMRQDDRAISGLTSQFSPVFQQTLKITADQPLFRGFREYAALNAAKSTIRYQEEARQWAGTQLFVDVSSSFNNVLALQADIQTLDNEIDLLYKRVSDLNHWVSIGRSRPTEVLTAKTSIAVLQATKVMEQGQVNVAREVLGFLTGLDAGISLNDSQPDSPAAHGLDDYLAHVGDRPDVRSATYNLDAFKSGVSIAKGAFLPSVDVTGNYYFERPGINSSIYWDASIVATMPLFQGGLLVSGVRVAQSQATQAELSLSLAKRAASETIRNDYQNLQSDQAQVTALAEAHDLAQRNYLAEAHDYTLGLISNVELLQALASAQDTQRALDRARFNAKHDFNRLEAESAQRLDLLKGM